MIIPFLMLNIAHTQIKFTASDEVITKKNATQKPNAKLAFFPQL